MSEDRSWGADTVAFGRAQDESRRSDPHRPHPPPRSRFATIARRAVASVTTFAAVAIVVLIVGAGGESDPRETSIREVADPALRVVVKPARRVPPLGRRRDLREPTSRHVHEASAKKRERERKTAAGAETQAQEVYELPVEPTPEYVPPPAPEPPPVPTSPAVEFGL